MCETEPLAVSGKTEPKSKTVRESIWKPQFQNRQRAAPSTGIGFGTAPAYKPNRPETESPANRNRSRTAPYETVSNRIEPRQP